jgi:hypothetical protein
MIAATAKTSEPVQLPGSPAHRLRNPREKATTTPMAVREPLRKVESMVVRSGNGASGPGAWPTMAGFCASLAPGAWEPRTEPSTTLPYGLPYRPFDDTPS